jgi:hypothetical protein
MRLGPQIDDGDALRDASTIPLEALAFQAALEAIHLTGSAPTRVAVLATSMGHIAAAITMVAPQASPAVRLPAAGSPRRWSRLGILTLNPEHPSGLAPMAR